MLGTPDVFDMLSGAGLFWDFQPSTDNIEVQLAYYLRQMRLVRTGWIWKKLLIIVVSGQTIIL